MSTEEANYNEHYGEVWPPPPSIGPPPLPPQPEFDEAAYHKRRAGVYCLFGYLFGWLVCGLLHIMTIYCAVKANRLAGRHVATHYIVLAVLQWAFFLALFIYPSVRFAHSR